MAPFVGSSNIPMNTQRLLLGIPRRECLMVLSEFFILFVFFRRQGFRMIIFDRQAGPFQNFNRSQVMVIGRSVSFSTPRDPRVGAWGAPNTPKMLRFKTPGKIFWRKMIFSY